MAEGDFLKVVTETRRVVVHFFHREFTRCKIMDKHLATLTHKFFSTRFVKVSAPVRRLVYPFLMSFAAQSCAETLPRSETLFCQTPAV